MHFEEELSDEEAAPRQRRLKRQFDQAARLREDNGGDGDSGGIALFEASLTEWRRGEVGWQLAKKL